MTRLLTWNTEWAAAGSARGCRIVDVFAKAPSDVTVCTEVCLGTLPPEGHVISGQPDWGYRSGDDSRRKIAIWSRQEWSDVDDVGDGYMPPGRFVAGTTTVPGIDALRVVGLCIPWRDAHVRTGRRDARPWQEHLAYLRTLPRVLERQPRPLVVAGDFNQRIPRYRQPREVHEALLAALGDLTLVTAGETVSGRLIDHVALSADLDGKLVDVIAKADGEGHARSDHLGAVVDLRQAAGDGGVGRTRVNGVEPAAVRVRNSRDCGPLLMKGIDLADRRCS